MTTNESPGPGAKHVLVGFVALALSACGGATVPQLNPSSPAANTTAASGGATDRPEGPWTVVAWTTKRSDTTNPQPLSRVLLTTATPACDSGPCDLVLSPSGVDGTYREPEAPAAAGHDPSKAPMRLTWDGTQYTGVTDRRTASCTPVSGKLVPEAYQSTTTVVMDFVRGAGDAPARVDGTFVTENSGTPTGRKQGCTDFTETEAFVGSPTGSVSADAAPSGEFDATLSSRSSTPKNLAPVGTVLWLGTMTASGSASTLTGLSKAAAPLAQNGPDWAGTAPTAPIDCQAAKGAVVTGGADGVESFADLHPIAVTKDGTMVLTGTWGLQSRPNGTGLKQKCGSTGWEGRLLLVPHGAG